MLNASLARTDGLPQNAVLLLDEAGMAPTRVTAELFRQAADSGAKLVAVGDSGQLTSVEAGGWLAAIGRQHAATPQLRQVVRQRSRAEREALQALHDGNPEPYLDHSADRITIYADEQDAITSAVRRWANSHAEDTRHAPVMIARDNVTRELINRAAREHLKAAGRLRYEVAIGSRNWAIGDRVIARQNDRQVDVDNGTMGTVVAINPTRGRVDILTDGGETRQLPLPYVARNLEHAYAITGHSSQGATVESAIVVGRPEEFSREWAYTALSRARGETVIQLVTGLGPSTVERDDYAPEAAEREPAEALAALARALHRSDSEYLASEQMNDQPPHVAKAQVAPPPIARPYRHWSALEPPPERGRVLDR